MTNNPASDAGLRLDKMLTTRAQMIQLEAQINELRGQGVDASNARLAKLESVLEKYQRKVVKMYAAGTEMAVFADFEEDVINLESWNEHKSMSKIEERLEKLLSPTSRSLICTITTGPKKNMAGKQRMAVTDTTEYFNLLKYSVEDAKNRKITKINVPENEFGEWLAGYRRLKAERERRAELDQDPWS
ncbi:hypothetical protein BJ165DRAFT_1457677 [Panaeolus papilionaceus]|nr:hypothetical protein BJ165DRAFT_1457677 [Panaeolus papilionaceus]